MVTGVVSHAIGVLQTIVEQVAEFQSVQNQLLALVMVLVMLIPSVLALVHLKLVIGLVNFVTRVQSLIHLVVAVKISVTMI